MKFPNLKTLPIFLLVHPHAARKTLFGIILLLPLVAQTQNKMRFDHFSVKEGLTQGNVWDIEQDRLGFIWIGTEDGLNIYDGYKFLAFRNNPADSTTLNGSYVDCLEEDHEGNMWVGTQNGLHSYNRELNRFQRILHDPKNPLSISSNNIKDILSDSKGNLWVATVNGLNVYNKQTKRWNHFFHDSNKPNSIADDVVETIIEDTSNRIWAGTKGGLSLLNSDRKTFTNFYHNENDPSSLSSNKIICMFEDQDKFIWIGTFDGAANKLNPSQKTFVRYAHAPGDPTSVGSNYIYDISQDKNGTMWFATDGAMCSFDNKQGNFTRYYSVSGINTGLNSNTITRIFFDKENRMWVGTRFGGINVYDKDKYAFEHFSFSGSDNNSLSHDNVSGMAESKNGDFWVATDGGGLCHYTRAAGKWSRIQNIFSNDKLLAVEQDNKGNLWLGMWAGGLNYFDPKTQKVKKYLNDPDNPGSLSDNNVFDILISKDGTVWVATWGNGLNKYNPATDNFTRYVHDPQDPTTYAGSPSTFLLEDRKGRILVGTEQHGFEILDPRTGIFTHYPAGNDKGQLSGTYALSLFQDSKDRIWIGTNGSGLNLFDEDTKTFTVFRQKDGLPNDAIQAIQEDNQGNLWISTNKGLTRFNFETKRFKNYTESDGLQSDQFNRWASYKLSTGELLFGGTNGFNLFNPESIKENPNKPVVYITDFKLFSKPVPIGEDGVLKQNILLTKEIVLDYDQNIFSFEFVALSLRQSEKNQYRYKLEGFDKDWSDAGTERKKEYTNLNPGRYIFRVIASNNDGLWNEEGASVEITIIPPFWKTWWFNTIAAMIIIGSIIGYNRYIKKKERKKQRDLQEIIEERTREVRQRNEEIVRKAEQEKINNWITQGLALISETISKNNHEIGQLGKETLKTVINHCNAQQGIIAIGEAENGEEYITVLATYGVSKTNMTKRIEIGSGLLGETYRDKEKKVLEHVPDAYLKIESGLGEAMPAKVVLLPLKKEDGEMVGVMEIAFLTPVTEIVLSFLDKASSVIALNIFAATLTQKTMMLLKESKERTEELRAQEEEMRQNMEELEATSEEFKRREIEYQKRIVELEGKDR
jgi:ligand-binding sensor domain-containing protein